MAVSLLACGPRPGIPAGAVSTPTPPQSGTVALSAADFERTLDVATGTTLTIALVERHPVPGSSSTWEASSSDEAVLHLDSAARQPAPRPVGDDTYTATFRALVPGSALIRLTNPQTCEAMLPSACPRNPDHRITVRVH